ncbi:MAG TPA: CocE/NonD family hydrolase [Dehalococcoidia bacterium]|nr:CocE/NonD family hydrolase [Dehalococcoidia bacterium]
MATTRGGDALGTTTRQGSAQQFDVVWERDVMVAMRDGIRLATDIYRPALNGRAVERAFPVLLERTPYNKLRVDLISTARLFARRGYVVALQDVRGRFNSEGEWYPFALEGPDGFDTVTWLTEHSWCNSRIGTMGLSYSGSDQTALATLDPPGLAAQFVSEGMSNYHTSAMRQGGAMELRFVIYAFQMAITSREAASNRPLRLLLERERANIREWLRRAPIRAGVSPLRHIPSYERWVLDVLTHGDYDDYWKQFGLNVEEYYDRHPDIPVYLLTGWYDSYCRSVTDNYVALSRSKRGPIRLIIGGWPHSTAPIGQTWSGDADFGPDAAVEYNDLRLRWFDQQLKGLETGLDDEPPVHVMVMGGGSGRKNDDGRLDAGGTWRSLADWPPPSMQPAPYYLQPGGGLGPERPQSGVTPSSYRFDPADPVPTIGGNISVAYEIMPPGGYDQRGRSDVFGATDHLPLAARHDVLVFQTPPLDRDLTLIGPVSVNLWASSSAIDTDFTAKLMDVYPPNADYPDGYALNLSDSIIRARYRNSREHAELMTPGEIYEFTVVLYPIGNVFKAGHRIRLDISSSNFPRFDVNPNTGEPLGLSNRLMAADQTVFHDAGHPSHIVVPIVPEG